MFTSPYRPDWLWGPPSHLSNEYRGALSPGIKRQDHEAEHSLPTSTEFKTTWIYTSTPLYVFMALVKCKDNCHLPYGAIYIEELKNTTE
jgi:hypothetical protein